MFELRPLCGSLSYWLSPWRSSLRCWNYDWWLQVQRKSSQEQLCDGPDSCYGRYSELIFWCLWLHRQHWPMGSLVIWPELDEMETVSNDCLLFQPSLICKANFSLVLRNPAKQKQKEEGRGPYCRSSISPTECSSIGSNHSVRGQTWSCLPCFSTPCWCKSRSSHNRGKRPSPLFSFSLSPGYTLLFCHAYGLSCADPFVWRVSTSACVSESHGTEEWWKSLVSGSLQ